MSKNSSKSNYQQVKTWMMTLKSKQVATEQVQEVPGAKFSKNDYYKSKGTTYGK